MISDYKVRRWLVLVLVGFATLLLSACGTATHQWLEAPGWSRSRFIGETESGYPVLPTLDSDGNRYLAITHIIQNVPIIEVLALAPDLRPLWQTEITLERLNRANKPSLILSERGLEVFWLMQNSLFTATLNKSGEIISQPTLVSGSQFVVDYDVAVGSHGERALWFSGDRANPGLYAVDHLGNITSVDRDGQKPQLQLDAEGNLHAAWLENASGIYPYDFFYAFYPDAIFSSGSEQLLHTASLAITSGIHGPELGLDGQRAYILWSELSRTGLSAGQVKSQYISFPYGAKSGSPEISGEINLVFPNAYDLNYREESSEENAPLQSGARAYISEQTANLIPRTTEIYANPSPTGELALAIRSRLPYLRNKEANQVGLVFIKDAAQESVQLLSFTPAITEFPSLRADDQGYLHATWLEQAQTDEYRLYYATTEPNGKASLDALTQEDTLRITGDALFGLLSGMVLIPFPIFWGLGPAVLTFITGPFRRENEPLTAPATLITMALGLAIYWLAKLFTLPGIMDYVPFSAWIPTLPENSFDLLRIGLPVFVGLLAFFVAYRSTYARENNTPLFFLLIYTLVDGLISIAIYGVIFYGAI